MHIRNKTQVLIIAVPPAYSFCDYI